MKLIAYHSSESGGMSGGFSATSVVRSEDGRCRVERTERAFHSRPTRCVRCEAEGLLEKLGSVCERYEVRSWTELPDRKSFMLDAATCQDSFIFEDGSKIVLGSGKEYPDHFSELDREIKKLIDEAVEQAAETEVTEEQPALPMGMMAAQLGKMAEVQKAADPGGEASEWARFCSCCGAKFSGGQNFCPECGSARKKR